MTAMLCSFGLPWLDVISSQLSSSSSVPLYCSSSSSFLLSCRESKPQEQLQGPQQQPARWSRRLLSAQGTGPLLTALRQQRQERQFEPVVSCLLLVPRVRGAFSGCGVLLPVSLFLLRLSSCSHRSQRWSLEHRLLLASTWKDVWGRSSLPPPRL